MIDSMFGLRLDNVPLANLRLEFLNHYALIHEPSFDKQFTGVIQPIESPYFRWLGMPVDFITVILQRAILGVEAYLPAAVYFALGYRGRLTQELGKKIQNPFSLGGRGTVGNFYDRLPALVDPRVSLKVSNPILWETNAEFYKLVRNPLFHGMQISDAHVPGVCAAFNHLADIYDWIDSWHSPDKMMPGVQKSFAISRHVTPNPLMQPTGQERPAAD